MKTILLAFLLTSFAHAGDIVALCIGNNAYVNPEDVLDTPVADAELMQRTLRAVPGVAAEDIVILRDAKRSEITLALRQLKARTKGAKLCLVFYSGHGVEDTPTGFDRAETFLLPVDADIRSADELPDQAVPLHLILDGLGAAGGARAVILDCCRTGAPSATKSLRRAGKDVSAIDDNVKRALGNAVLPEGTLIAFAASPGRKAAAFLKETDTNSPFTYFIAEEMSRQGRDLLSIINAASTITKERTEMRQVPHVELRGDVSLIMNVAIPAARPGAMVAVPVIPLSPVPEDAASHPPYWLKLMFVDRKQRYFSIRFAADNNPAFQVDINDQGRKAAHFVRAGDSFYNGRFTVLKYEKTDGNGNVGTLTNQSELTLQDHDMDKELTLIVGEDFNYPTYFGQFDFTLDPAQKEFFVRVGDRFALLKAPGAAYQLVDIDPTGSVATVKVPDGTEVKFEKGVLPTVPERKP